MPFNPVSTYRLQFHKEFTLDNFEQIVPYLQKLGIHTIYASPVFKSNPGSTHGYDALDPHQINPEIGSEDKLVELSRRLKESGIGWIQDIVPNHMAFSPDNPWIMDLLEKGPQSVYASFFDTPMSSGLYKGRLMVPFLGSDPGEVIGNGELTIGYEQGRFVFNYYDTLYPLNPRSYSVILNSGERERPEALSQLLSQMQQIHQIEDPTTYSDSWNEFLLQLSGMMKDEVTGGYIHQLLEKVNENPDTIKKLAEEQVYRLCSWQETDQHITFRRFFTVNGLICLNIQDKEVFDTYHKYIKTLMNEGVFDGLRVDHVDGLFDPTTYLGQLRELAGDDAFIAVEKILESGEELPGTWPIQGNTGYDFLSLTNNLFTNPGSQKQFTAFYDNLIGKESNVQRQVYEKKAYILYEHMGGELENLYRLLLESDLIDSRSAAYLQDGDLKLAIGEFLVQCPVYRHYGNRFPLPKAEEKNIAGIIKRIRIEKPELSASAKILEDIFINKPKEANADYNERALYFYQRCMQFSGPLMAKGVEDTLMYTYNRFIAHNEVGDSPEAFGMSPDEFHLHMQYRQQHWPLSMNATSTHDTKRGEDVRARLNVLSDIPDEWFGKVESWIKQNEKLKQDALPDVNDEYLIYQTIAGAYPMPGQPADDFKERIQQYIEKALREAKVNSNWTEPNSQYEESAKKFAISLLDKKGSFMQSFEGFHQKISDLGIINSLAQVILKFTCPGVPDVYQGCELWDLSMVDPDNRRPVDYASRLEMLEELEHRNTGSNLHDFLWESRYEGHIKLWLTQTLLAERKDGAEVFEKGDYIPLKVKGKFKNHLIAFARRHKQTWYIVALPLHLSALCEDKKYDVTQLNWKNTRIMLPEGIPSTWIHTLHADLSGNCENEIHVSDIFVNLPFAVLKFEKKEKDRGAGILMHITSLPSAFGTGDFGPEAVNFARFLARSQQKYWQILPLSPTEQGSGYSPYSSYSSMAGNPLLISPELLAEEGLVPPKKLADYHLPVKSETDFAAAEKVREVLFEKAFHRFKEGDFSVMNRDFERFCEQEAYWLDDFAIYTALKQQSGGKAWYEWDDDYKFRTQAALNTFAENNSDAIGKTKWLQFIFTRQWNALKAYCNNLGIQIFGDMPFYVSYDSADVWANRSIFCLDNNGNMTGVAGVPPDYFNDNGQLWGMPVFRWDALKEENYKWWVQRVRKNTELFDVLRFDHFRAFSAYWEVPATEQTAKNGVWKAGPGRDFFEALQQNLGKLPFVAEDLGDIDAPVYQLRDEFGLPGMKVLQFAFGADMPEAIAIPHQYTRNFFVYTGTHDNNTTKGWYQNDADETIRKNLTEYSGINVKAGNAHLVLGRMAYASVANTAILPMQDVMGLGGKARMNSPASAENNWQWRIKLGKPGTKEEKRLREWVRIYGR